MQHLTTHRTIGSGASIPLWSPGPDPPVLVSGGVHLWMDLPPHFSRYRYVTDANVNHCTRSRSETDTVPGSP